LRRKSAFALLLVFVMRPKEDLVKGACCGDARLVRSALRRGSNPDAGYRGRTVLLWAIQERHFDVVKVLVRARASLEKRDAKGFTAIDQAVGQGSLKIVEFLLKSGAKANSRNANGTPLHTACAWRRLQIARLLLQHGADPEAFDGDGRKPIDLMTSTKSASEKALKKILRRGELPSGRSGQGR
jgi:ankyrin repeat protein